jgi:hypothetical protein
MSLTSSKNNSQTPLSQRLTSLTSCSPSYFTFSPSSKLFYRIHTHHTRILWCALQSLVYADCLLGYGPTPPSASTNSIFPHQHSSPVPQNPSDYAPIFFVLTSSVDLLLFLTPLARPIFSNRDPEEQRRRQYLRHKKQTYLRQAQLPSSATVTAIFNHKTR